MTDTVDIYASMPHYHEHLLPIVRALPEQLQGKVYAPRELRGRIDGPVEWGTPPNSTMPLLVAGYSDLRYARRPKVHVAHGASQKYVGIDSPSYVGGPGREAVDLFLCSNEASAALERARYPRARAVAVGCPKLDLWKQVPRPHNVPPVIAVTFKWNSHIGVPEGSWAWPTWRTAIEQLATMTKILGHCHPRARRELEPWWRNIGVEYVPRAVDVLARADVLIVDNSSVAYEVAACGMPVVFISSADWRPDVHHGLRFGDLLPGPDLGVCVSDDSDPTAAEALKDVAFGLLEETNVADYWRTQRWNVTSRVYGPDDMGASARAAAAVLDLIEHGPNPRSYRKAEPCRNC